MKKSSILFANSVLILCFGVIPIIAQTKTQSIGNVIIKVGSDIVLRVPINNKIPLLRGDKYRIETSSISSMFQIDTLAISEKPDEAIITFRVTNQTDSRKIRSLTKRFNLKKGERKTFNFKIKLALEPRNYTVVAFYEPKEINNEQPTTDN